MTAFKINQFGGMIPAVDSTLLPEHAAVYARDCYLYKGNLIGWRKPKVLFNLVNSTTRAAYRVPAALNQTSILDTSYWLEFDDVDTDVVRSPVSQDTFQRYYYASPSIQPRYNATSRIAVGSDPWLLGVPAPTDGPSIVVTGGGSGLADARSYVYTWVTSYAEEGPPSPATLQNGYTDSVWNLSIDAPSAGDMGTDRDITTVNIYRTVVSSSGVASYFLVGSQPASVTTFSDTLTDEVVALNQQLESTTWSAPPTDLKGMVLMPNGMIVGWRENEIWFCEPYRPHAWPPNFVLTTDYPIVGMGVIGQSAVVLTTAFPYILSGVSPSAATAVASRVSEPCNSKGSIVATPGAVFYTSPNGLISVDPSGTVQNVTPQLLLREDWKSLTPPISNRAAQVGPAYMAFGSVFVDPALGNADNATYANQGFTVDLSTFPKFDAGTWSSLPQTAFGLLSSHTSYEINNFWADPWTAVPLLMANQQVWYYDFSDPEPDLVPYRWRSRIIQMGAKVSFGAMRCWFSVPTSTPAHETDRVVTPGMTFDANAGMYGVLRVYVSTTGDVESGSFTLLTDRDMFASGELLRIGSGQKYEFWQYEIEAIVNVNNLQVASTVKELAKV